MGRAAHSTVIYVGLARLPQPLVTAAPAVALELEVDMSNGEIAAAHVNLPFPTLQRLLRDLLVGKHVEACTNGALLELEVRYSAPFAPALRVALQAAAKRALADLATTAVCATRSIDDADEQQLVGQSSGPALGVN